MRLPLAALREPGISTRVTRLVALALLAAASAWAVLILASGTNATSNGISVAYRLYAIAAPTVVGVMWWRRRPESRMGTLLVILGTVSAVMAWQSSVFPLPFSLGVLAEGAQAALVIYLCLTFPTGRLTGRIAPALMALLAVTLLFTFVPWFASGSAIHGNNAAFDCRPACPPNMFQITTIPESSRTALLATGMVLVSVIGLAAVGLHVSRIRRARRLGRRALIALGVTSLLLFPAAAIYVAVEVVSGPELAQRIGLTISFAAALVVFPIGFAVPLVQSDLAAGNELQSLLAALTRRPSRATWRDRIAAVLDDPHLRLGYWDESAARYVEADGRELSKTAAESDRLWMVIDRDAQPVAAMETDPTLAMEPELTDAVAVATVAAITRRQLEGARNDLWARAASAAEMERGRVAREIRAGPQQRLAALRVHVNLLGEREPLSPDHSFIEEFGRGLDKAIGELGDTARTSASSNLTGQGLGAALRAARNGSPITVQVSDRGLRRHPPRAELAVYYCSLEAIQNTIKHAGPSATVTVRLFESRHGIGFAIEDDGFGFDAAEVVPGSGLQNISERIAAVGGTVSVESTPGRGTVISGSVPDVVAAP